MLKVYSTKLCLVILVSL